jgi:hypothetical protein
MKTNVCEPTRTARVAVSGDDLGGYVYALALVQFAALALGYMSVTILDKVEGGASGLSQIAGGLVGAGMWMFLVPLIWFLAAMATLEICPRTAARHIVRWTGGLLTLGIIAILVLATL